MIVITGWKHANFTLMGKVIEELGYERTMIPYALNRGDDSLGKRVKEHRNKYCIDELFYIFYTKYDIPIKYLIQVESPKKVFNELKDTTLEYWYHPYDMLMMISKNDRFLYTLEELITYPKYTLTRLFNFLRTDSNMDKLAELCRAHTYNKGEEITLESKYQFLMKQMRSESHRDLF